MSGDTFGRDGRGAELLASCNPNRRAAPGNPCLVASSLRHTGPSTVLFVTRPGGSVFRLRCSQTVFGAVAGTAAFTALTPTLLPRVRSPASGSAAWAFLGEPPAVVHDGEGHWPAPRGPCLESRLPRPPAAGAGWPLCSPPPPVPGPWKGPGVEHDPCDCADGQVLGTPRRPPWPAASGRPGSLSAHQLSCRWPPPGPSSPPVLGWARCTPCPLPFSLVLSGSCGSLVPGVRGFLKSGQFDCTPVVVHLSSLCCVSGRPAPRPLGRWVSRRADCHVLLSSSIPRLWRRGPASPHGLGSCALQPVARGPGRCPSARARPCAAPRGAARWATPSCFAACRGWFAAGQTLR